MAAGHTVLPEPVLDFVNVNGDLPLPSPTGRFRLYYDSGNNGLMCSREGAAAKPLLVYDLTSFVNGKPGAGAVVYRYVATRPLTIPQNFTGSQLAAGTAATAQAVYNAF